MARDRVQGKAARTASIPAVHHPLDMLSRNHATTVHCGRRGFDASPASGRALAEASARRAGGDSGSLDSSPGRLSLGHALYGFRISRGSDGLPTGMAVTAPDGRMARAGFLPAGRRVPEDRTVWRVDLGKDFLFSEWDAIVHAVS